jgi:3-hydroxymyristoyl/3-hydroxydecanoyl-(acyl carrier protein) dehydratase
VKKHPALIILSSIHHFAPLLWPIFFRHGLTSHCAPPIKREKLRGFAGRSQKSANPIQTHGAISLAMNNTAADFSAGPQSTVITVDTAVPADSPWFSGHFPGNPILPGIAQLEMVAAAIAQSSGKNLYVTRLGRVKFKALVHPDERLRIEARAKAEVGTFAFSIHAGDSEVCSGTMILSEKNKENT